MTNAKTIALCFSSGQQEVKPFEPRVEYVASLSTNDEFERSMSLLNQISSEAQLAHTAHEIPRHRKLFAPGSLIAMALIGRVGMSLVRPHRGAMNKHLRICRGMRLHVGLLLSKDLR